MSDDLRLDEPGELAAHLADAGDVDEPLTEWSVIRALAHGCPLDTAPDHIWRTFCMAMRECSREVLAAHLWQQRRAAQEGGQA